MRLRTKLCTVLFLALAMTGLFVCSLKGTVTPREEVEETVNLVEEKDTIYFWFADETMSDYISSAAVVFGEKYGVRVIPQLVSGSEYLEAINHASVHEGPVPDAYLLTNDSLEKAYLAGLATEINDVNGIMTEENFSQAARDAVTYKGKMIAYPVSYETTVLLYNETFLQEWALQQVKAKAEEDGVNYDEATYLQKRDEMMLSAVPKTIPHLLTVSDTFDAPETVEAIFRWDVSDILYNYHFVGNYMIVGGDCGDDKNNIVINNEQVIECLKIYKALNQFFYIESDLVSYESVIRDFLDGKLVFTIATTDVVKVLEQATADGSFAYKYGVAVMPEPSADLKGRSLSVTSVVAVNGYSEQQELANRFATFLATEYAGELYERAGKAAANKNVIPNDMMYVFQQEYAGSIPLNKMIDTSNFWLQLEILFSKVWNGEDEQTLLEALEQQIESQIIK